MPKTGQIHIYTGDGKGKTTAALGLALRALGQGLKVFIIQFMKGGAYTGEFISAKNFLPHLEIEQFGRPCIKEQKQLKLKGFDPDNPLFDFIREDIDCGDCRYCFLNDEIQKDYVEKAFQKAYEIINQGQHSLVILDEINLALSYGFLETERVIALLQNKPEHVEVVLTGRKAPQALMQIANLVTEMKMHKHYFYEGVPARRGIEY
ncbi:MAG TPA: cob(I)yrinic acid a,c-diamide adenosyltransferase [Candidatus Aminicenantes bacterium]|nr:cob(I)yrinic acid a,c-diamide adenosyltransferase [Candidatus Aminicenantes bacterium]